MMKWIILAGWSGTRLYPITKGTSKQLLPIYDKPMIYYPLSVLMQAGIREILVITTPEDQAGFIRLLGDGKKRWIELNYAVQPSPDGLAQAFIIGEEFIGDEDVCLVLGDNLFYGQSFWSLLNNAVQTVTNERKSVVFGYEVKNPEIYGVVELDKEQNAVSIEEKPANPKSNLAVVGLYFYTNDVIQVAKNIKPSARWELEITTVNEEYMHRWKLKVEVMERGFARLDTGSHESMLDASNFVQIVQTRQGIQICCPEEIAFRQGWISRDEVSELAKPLLKSNYWFYLMNL